MTTITAEDRSGAMLAHLSGYAGYLVPCGGVLLPLVLIFTLKSRTLVAIAKQALFLNVLGLMTFLFAILAGAQLVFLAQRYPVAYLPVALVGLLGIGVVGLVLLCPIIGAVKASGGEYFRYPLFGVRQPD
ncbi:MAG: DUF4870 domain-containing protein [Myxococcota bacterium]